MKLKIYYENHSQFLEVDTDEMWSCLGFEDTNVPAEEKEKLIQDKVDKEWNNPDYNNWKNYQSHIYVPLKDEAASSEELIKRMPTKDSFESLLIAMEGKNTRKKIRQILGKHKEWADIVIAIVLDGYKTNEIAKAKGVSHDVISHKYSRAIKLLKTFYKKRHKTPSANVDI